MNYFKERALFLMKKGMSLKSGILTTEEKNINIIPVTIKEENY